jgi:hypothetical protein
VCPPTARLPTARRTRRARRAGRAWLRGGCWSRLGLRRHPVREPHTGSPPIAHRPHGTSTFEVATKLLRYRPPDHGANPDALTFRPPLGSLLVRGPAAGGPQRHLGTKLPVPFTNRRSPASTFKNACGPPLRAARHSTYLRPSRWPRWRPKALGATGRTIMSAGPEGGIEAADVGDLHQQRRF